MNFQPSPFQPNRILPFLAVPLLLLNALLTGCESIQEKVRTTRDLPPLTHEYDFPAEAVLAAAPVGLERIGMKVTRTSAAQGLIEAISDIRRDAGIGRSKQLRMKMTVVHTDGGGSRASLQIWEIREDENARGERFASEVGVGSIALHESVFSAVEYILKAPTE